MRLLSQSGGLVTKIAREDGATHISYEQDVSSALDFAHRLRSERTVDTINSDHTINHVAFVPNGIILKMLFEDGVNFYDPEQSRAVMGLLETKYKNFKSTDKRLA